MTSYVGPAIYAAVVWWFSTGAVLLLVGLSARFEVLRVLVAGGLTASALYGLSVTANDFSVAGAVLAFTSTILLWGAQEIAFLAGWLTGPRPLPCPPDARGIRRLGFALAAILYHELSLIACGVATGGTDMERAEHGRAVDLRGAVGVAAKREDQSLCRRARHQ